MHAAVQQHLVDYNYHNYSNSNLEIYVAGETGSQKPHEVQQGELQSPAPGVEQPQAPPIYAGAVWLENSLTERSWESWWTPS